MERKTPEQARQDTLAICAALLLDALYDYPRAALLPHRIREAAAAVAAALDAVLDTTRFRG